MSNSSEEAALKLMEEQTNYIKILAKNQKTLRDDFAMAALNGLLSTTKSYWMGLTNPETNIETAKFSYSLADAMLEARKAKGE